MSDEYIGHRAVTSSGSDHNTERLHVEKVLSEHRTNVPVKIVKVYPGKDGAAPTADVQVLIDQVDGAFASPTPHAVVYGVAFAVLDKFIHSKACRGRFEGIRVGDEASAWVSLSTRCGIG